MIQKCIAVAACVLMIIIMGCSPIIVSCDCKEVKSHGFGAGRAGGNSYQVCCNVPLTSSKWQHNRLEHLEGYSPKLVFSVSGFNVDKVNKEDIAGLKIEIKKILINNISYKQNLLVTLNPVVTPRANEHPILIPQQSITIHAKPGDVCVILWRVLDRPESMMQGYCHLLLAYLEG